MRSLRRIPLIPPAASPSAQIEPRHRPLARSRSPGRRCRPARGHRRTPSTCTSGCSPPAQTCSAPRIWSTPWGSGCRHIYVDDAARIDLANLYLHHTQFVGYDALNTYGVPQAGVLTVPDGVTLESDRSARHAGGLLYMSKNLGSPTAMLALRPGDRITGLRLHGYSFGTGGDEDYTIGDKYGITDGLEVTQPDVLIDNNDIGGWPGAGETFTTCPTRIGRRLAACPTSRIRRDIPQKTLSSPRSLAVSTSQTTSSITTSDVAMATAWSSAETARSR